MVYVLFRKDYGRIRGLDKKIICRLIVNKFFDIWLNFVEKLF